MKKLIVILAFALYACVPPSLYAEPTPIPTCVWRPTPGPIPCEDCHDPIPPAPTNTPPLPPTPTNTLEPYPVPTYPPSPLMCETPPPSGIGVSGAEAKGGASSSVELWAGVLLGLLIALVITRMPSNRK